MSWLSFDPDPRIYVFYAISEHKKRRRIEFYAASWEEACEIMQDWCEKNKYDSYLEASDDDD